MFPEYEDLSTEERDNFRQEYESFRNAASPPSTRTAEEDDGEAENKFKEGEK